MDKIDLLAEGTFSVGCNYWASHAGTRMWSDWRPEVVAADFKQLSTDAGLQVVRIFPLWPDFQPLKMHFGGCGHRQELRCGEAPLGHDELGKAGIDPVMMERFAFVLDEAARHGLTVIASLLTGWMSGRLYVPPAFENLNVLADPFPIKWEIKFVKAFVKHFKSHPAITAWEFGNECNCMGGVKNADEAYLWAASVGDAIRASDPTRPLLSGMHSVQAYKQPWLIEDQGEICDALTTHPYPLFTPHCQLDPVDGMRGGLHATAESRLYADVGGKPCLVEEIGTLGPMFGSREIAANYVRMSLMSSLAHDCHSFIWWCAYDQDHLTNTPYDWNACERELGIFHKDRSPKPVAAAFKEFREFNARLPHLPPRSTEAVCVLTDCQDNWGVAYASFILAKQAGFDLEFQKANQPLKPSPLYLLPSLTGGHSPTRSQWLGLLEAVNNGSELYLSIADPMLSPFEEIIGLRVSRRSIRSHEAELAFDFMEGAFRCAASVRLELEVVGAEVHGRETDGNPCFSSFKLGKGTVHFLSVSLETALVVKPGGFDSSWWRLYRRVAERAMSGRALAKTSPTLGITEHHEADGSRTAMLINYSSKAEVFALSLKDGWRVSETLWGEKPEQMKQSLPANGAAALRLINGRDRT